MHYLMSVCPSVHLSLDQKSLVLYYLIAAQSIRQVNLCQRQVAFFFICSDFGKNLTLLQFNGKHVVMRRGEGSIVATGVSPYPAILHSYVNQSRWDDAVRLCRFVKVFVQTPSACRFKCNIPDQSGVYRQYKSSVAAVDDTSDRQTSPKGCSTSFLSPPVRMHGGLLCIAFCLS